MTESGAKVAVVLSGGGAYGAFEVGVLKALCGGECATTDCKPLDADVFTGTSVGSFNAAVMCMQPGVAAVDTVKQLEEIWLNRVAYRPSEGGTNGVYRLRGNPMRYLDLSFEDPARALLETANDATYLTREWLNRFASILSTPGSFQRRAMGLVDLSSFISVEPFQRLLAENLQLDPIRAPGGPALRIILTDWSTGEPKIFDNSDMTDEHGRLIVMGSSAIPGIFPPVKIGNDLYVDGGVVMNTPLTTALEAGAEELHVIYLDPDVSKIPVAQMPNTIDTFSRMYTIMLATSINEDIATASWINGGLETMEKVELGVELTTEDQRRFIRVAGKIAESLQAGKPYKKLKIHRYNPSEDLGGLVGMLNFTEPRVRSLIEKGYETGVNHNCKDSGCLIPKEVRRAAHETG